MYVSRVLQQYESCCLITITSYSGPMSWCIDENRGERNEKEVHIYSIKLYVILTLNTIFTIKS